MFEKHSSHSNSIPRDSWDLAALMSFVTSVGGISAWIMRRNIPGALAGIGVASLFAFGASQIQKDEIKHPKSHEDGHQICLIGSLMFTGAMSYRAGSNPLLTGPTGSMLAALGIVSSLYHGDKMLEWRRWEESHYTLQRIYSPEEEPSTSVE